MIATILTSPGSYTNVGDWLNIGNIEVSLAPNTTNAYTWGIYTNGAGYCNPALEPIGNAVGWGTLTAHGSVFSGQPIDIISPPLAAANGTPETAAGGASNVVAYGIATQTAIGSLWITNTEAVFSLGITPGFVSPIVTTNPVSYRSYSGNFGGQRAWTFFSGGTGSILSPYGLNGYWQKGTTNVANGPTNWTVVSSSGNATVTTSVTNVGFSGASVGSSLALSGLTSSDLGAYRFIVTNAFTGNQVNSATSAVATITSVVPAANSFASAVISNGAVAYWPLDETVDPSTEKALAFDIIGGFNGWYGNNANDAAGNSKNFYAAIAGPSAPTYTGFPSNNGTYGGMQNSRPYTYVVVSNTPTFSGGPNVTMMAWIYPLNNPPSSGNGPAILMKRAGAYGATGGNCGIQFSSTTQLGYHWNPDAATEYNAVGPVVPSLMWSMVAVVVTPTATMMYVCNTNNGLQVVTTNNPGIVADAWGTEAIIGADPGNSNPGRTFVGYISSLAMFPSSLSVGRLHPFTTPAWPKATKCPSSPLNPPSRISF